jgi:hypothetical protein
MLALDQWETTLTALETARDGQRISDEQVDYLRSALGESEREKERLEDVVARCDAELAEAHSFYVKSGRRVEELAGINPNAVLGFSTVTWTRGTREFLITAICRSCGRALGGGPGGWHDYSGTENCPTPWPDSVFHEPAAHFHNSRLADVDAAALSKEDAE